MNAMAEQMGLAQVEFWQLLVAGSVLLSWTAVGLALVCLRRVNRQYRETLERCEQLSRDLKVAGKGAIGMGQRIISLERKLCGHVTVPQAKQTESVQASIQPTVATSQAISEAARPLSKIVAATLASAATPFDKAKQLLAQGMAIDDVAQRCGLSRAEAGLMAMLERQKGVVAG